MTHYRDPEKVKRLLSFGDMSSLDAEIGFSHDFDDRECKSTKYYGRDRGESGEHTHPKRFKHRRELKRSAAAMGCEFVYLYEKGAWIYSQRGPQFFGCDDGAKFSLFEPLVDGVVQEVN